MILIISTVYVSVVVLLIANLRNHDISIAWLFIRSIPFLFADIFFFSSFLYSSVSFYKDLLFLSPVVSHVFLCIKMVVYVSSIATLFAGVIIFKSEPPQETLLYLSFSLIFLISIVISEIYSALPSSSLGVSRRVQIYSLIIVAVYNIFFNYANWPTRDIIGVQQSNVNDLGAQAADL
jgi:hypothetical protein